MASNPLASCVLGPDGRVRGASDLLDDLVGGDVAGTSFASLVAEDDAARFAAAWARHRELGLPVTCSVRLRDAARNGRSAEVLLVPSPSSDEPVTVAVVLEVQRHERQARLLRRVTEAANSTSQTQVLFAQVVTDIVATLDWQSGRVVEVTGQRLEPVASGGATRARSEAARQACASGRPDASSWAPDASDEGGATTGAVALPVLVAGEVMAVLEFDTCLPVVDDPDLLSVLGQIGQQLGSVVEREQVRAALDAQTRELERSNEELERFAYVASHDLQEPLRKIVGFSELLEARFADSFDTEGREYLEYVVGGARRMQRLIKDLLAYSRAGRATPSFEVVDLHAVVLEVVDMLDWTSEEAGAQITVAPLPPVWGDAGQLSEIITNLVANAIKYGPEGGATITIDAHPVPQRPEWEVTITDDGIGIDPRYEDQIFEVFRRLHSTAEYPGTGIGLAVTRRFVDAHGGRIWMTPAEGGGSVFHVTLPAPPEETT